MKFSSFFLVTPALFLFTLQGAQALDCIATQVANSDLSAAGSINGDVGVGVVVTCDAGYNGSGTATCADDGNFNVVTCAASSCTATQVANSNKSATDSITGVTGGTVTVTCDASYNGGGTATCAAGGAFNTITCAANACTSTAVANSDKSAALTRSLASLLATPSR